MMLDTALAPILPRVPVFEFLTQCWREAVLDKVVRVVADYLVAVFAIPNHTQRWSRSIWRMNSSGSA